MATSAAGEKSKMLFLLSSKTLKSFCLGPGHSALLSVTTESTEHQLYSFLIMAPDVSLLPAACGRPRVAPASRKRRNQDHLPAARQAPIECLYELVRMFISPPQSLTSIRNDHAPVACRHLAPTGVLAPPDPRVVPGLRQKLLFYREPRTAQLRDVVSSNFMLTILKVRDKISFSSKIPDDVSSSFYCAQPFGMDASQVKVSQDATAPGFIFLKNWVGTRLEVANLLPARITLPESRVRRFPDP